MDATYQRWNPTEYARNSSAQLQWATELLSRVVLRGDESVLDIGCGDGKVTALIARRLPRGSALGVDASPGMVEFARASFPPAGHPNLSFRLMDATRLDLAGKYDLAFSNAALHWIEDQPPVLRVVRRHLKDGGRFVIQMGGEGNAAGIISVLQAMILDPAWRDAFHGFRFPYRFCGVKEYRSWLGESGFTPSTIELITKDMQHDCADALKGWIRATWFPYTDRLPPDKREAFLDQAVETYIREHPLDSRGRTHVKMVRLEVEAVAS